MFLQAADFPIEAIRAQIFEGIDVMIHLGRLPDKSRKVLEISELTGLSSGGEFYLNTLFKYDAVHGLVGTGSRLENDEKMQLKGYVNEHRV